MTENLEAFTAASMDQEIVIYDKGDLHLLIGRRVSGPVFRIQVSRDVLQLASPAWAAMLDPKVAWAESNKGEIELPDDDANAMLVVLRLAHLKFPPAGFTLTNRLLYNLAVLCDKYDLVSLVQPFVETWARVRSTSSTSQLAVDIPIPSPPKRKRREVMEQLFIDWTFHRYDEFVEHAHSLILEAANNEKGQIVDSEGEVSYSHTPLPRQITDDILAMRRQYIATILNACVSHMEFFHDSQVCQSKSESVRSLCDAMAYGSMTMSLRNLFPILEKNRTQGVNKSLAEISCYLRESLVCNTLGDIKGYDRHGLHKDCKTTATLARVVKAIMANLERAIKAMHIDHFSPKETV